MGNKQEYDRKVAADPALREYERIYKLHHAQYDRDKQKETPTGKISKAEKQFKYWSKMAKELRKSYLNGKVYVSEFQSWMGQQ